MLLLETYKAILKRKKNYELKSLLNEKFQDKFAP